MAHTAQNRSVATAVAVAYASRHGSTGEIAERIAAVLGDRGLDAEAVPAGEVADLSRYAAVVLGSAVYMGRWRPEAWDFVHHHRDRLAAMPLWLFRSGPVGEAAQNPDEVALPLRVARAAHRLHARGHVTFRGRVPPESAGFMARAVAKKIPLEQQDARDWDAIEAWAGEIAAELQKGAAAEARATS
jgi:menaquinone-dependent protoporphyrinogen oxidase